MIQFEQETESEIFNLGYGLAVKQYKLKERRTGLGESQLITSDMKSDLPSLHPRSISPIRSLQLKNPTQSSSYRKKENSMSRNNNNDAYIFFLIMITFNETN